jgi:hypothetical protein
MTHASWCRSNSDEASTFRLADGKPQWSHTFKGTIRSIGDSGDVLYIGRLGGTVYAYAPEKSHNKQPSEVRELRVELERMLYEDQKLRAEAQAVTEVVCPLRAPGCLAPAGGWSAASPSNCDRVVQ